MTNENEPPPERLRRAGQVVEALARYLAILGGLVLVAMVLMTSVSIVGRSLVSIGLRPVPGDFELVEAGSAFVVFCFLPWCQLRGGHVSVGILVQFLPSRAQALLGVIANAGMSAAAALIVWRLALGLFDKTLYGETTLILQFPVWWGYALAMLGAAGFVVVCLFTVWRSVEEMLSARRLDQDEAVT